MIRDNKVDGEVIAKYATPRSYVIRTPNGSMRRNRSAIAKLSDENQDNTEMTVQNNSYAQNSGTSGNLCCTPRQCGNHQIRPRS